MPKVELTKLSEGVHPVLFVPHAAGGVLSFANLVRHLHPEQPCYVLKGKGIDSSRHSFKNCYHLARSYVDKVIQIQPEGPYMICGRQAETVIEVGQQLMQRGKTVSLTMIFDTGPPKQRLGGKTPSKSRRILYRARQTLLNPFSVFLDLICAALKRTSPRSRSEDDLSLMERVRLERFGQKRDVENPRRINQRLISDYIAQPYHARVVFIQSRGHRSKCPGYVNSWRTTADEVVYHTTPGEHRTMFELPQLYVLAGLVQKECDRARNAWSNGEEQTQVQENGAVSSP